ncbi:hypothetical protein F53441_14032 [Fusarium austroafricanum]|uniref:Uncharacterized protein n=1 Tax=Fusarium austroafricanum TaxID=2364996 RepID=A0A8H4JKV3_9HYPO|nr:hypothetical protein F53441_14032 [Fusarium austroafricanum]
MAQVTDPEPKVKGKAVGLLSLPEQTNQETMLEYLREKVKALDLETKSASTKNFENALENHKEEILYETPVKVYLNYDIDEISRNWLSARHEASNKLPKIRSILQRLESSIDHESRMKYYLKDAIDEITRNWLSTQFEAYAKDVNLEHVGERLKSTIDRETKLKGEVQFLKKNKTILENQLRQSYLILTKYRMGEHHHTLEDGKRQMIGKLHEKFLNEGILTDDPARLLAHIQGLGKMIMNLKIGTENLENENEELEESGDFFAELEIARFKAYIQAREDFIAELEEEKKEFEKEMNELASQQD